MLYYFDKNKIRKGQAYKKHDVFKFAAWVDDMTGKKVIQEAELKEVYESHYFELTFALYYNDKLVSENFSTYTDFYGFGKVFESAQETINTIQKKYSLTAEDKLDLRVYVGRCKQTHFLTADGFRDVIGDWYISPEDAKKFEKFTQEDRFDNKKMKELNLEKANHFADKELFHSTFEDGFVLKTARIEQWKNDFIKEKDLTIAAEEELLKYSA